MHDAVDWKIIDENPFSKVRTQRSTVKVNEFVPREVVDKLMKKANPVWKVILGLSRYGGLRTPSETLSLRWEDIDWEMNRMSIPEPKVEHHEGRGIRSCPIFPELRSILDEAFEIFGDKSEYVVAAPQYRAAANTAMGWKNSNLRTEMTRLLRRAGVSGWPRLFHSMRASRQTELQREFPLHVVCSWLGNSPRIAQQSYLLVTEDDFAKAAGVPKVMAEGLVGVGRVPGTGWLTRFCRLINYGLVPPIKGSESRWQYRFIFRTSGIRYPTIVPLLAINQSHTCCCHRHQLQDTP